MTVVYLDSYTIEAYISSAWSDLTSDVIAAPITGEWGIIDNTAVDLIADTGEMEFLLNNQDNYYVPGLGTSLTGWGKNTPIRLKMTFEGVPYIRFRGYVDYLEIVSEKFNRKSVRVVCVDWMDYAARYPLIGPVIETNKRADEGLVTIVSGMPIAPQSTDYDQGNETFLTIFDDVSVTTRGYSEMSKLVNSEWGYLYVTKDQSAGETLVFENNKARHGLRTLTEIPIADNNLLLLETDDELLLETGDSILLSEVDAFVIDNLMTSLKIEYGTNVVNHFQTSAYPKIIDTGNQVLFSLDKPITLSPGVMTTFRTSYRDPSGGNPISAVSTSMVTPAITTDYLMNAQSDGGGADLSADLTISATYGTEGVTYSLTNDNANIGYITHLQARGIGVYSYSPIQDIKENAASILEHGYHMQFLDQKYKQDLLLGSLMGEAISYKERNPRVDLSKVNLIANRSANLMNALLNIDIGDLVHIKEDESGIDGYYYIQGISFSIKPGGIIDYSWMTRRAYSISNGLTMLAIEFDEDSVDGGGDNGDAINFGYIPHVVNLGQSSYSFWIYVDADTVGRGYVIGPWSDTSGKCIMITADGKISNYCQYSVQYGWWLSAASSVPFGEWVNIVVTHDTSVTPTTAPILYINGTSVDVTELVAPEGTIIDQTGTPLTIGNWIYTGGLWNEPFNGEILDARIYDSILTQTNVTALYNAGTPDNSILLNSNLKFQAACVMSEDAATFTDAAFSSTDRVIDNIYGYVGTTNNGPVGRAFPT